MVILAPEPVPQAMEHCYKVRLQVKAMRNHMTTQQHDPRWSANPETGWWIWSGDPRGLRWKFASCHFFRFSYDTLHETNIKFAPENRLGDPPKGN